MTHDEIQEKLHDLHDGELSPAQAAELALHIENCRECGSTLDDIKRISRALFSSKTPASQEDFVQRVMARIEEEEPAVAPWSLIWRLPTFGLGLAAAAFLLMAHVGGDSYFSMEELLLADNQSEASSESLLLASAPIDSDDVLGAALEE